MNTSDAARELSSRRRLRHLVCPVCGRAFETIQGPARYCSPSCKYRATANRAGRTPRQPRPVAAL